MSVVDQTHPVTIAVESPLDAAGASLFREAVRREIADRHEECLRWFALHPATPEDLLIEIYQSGLCLDDLGHRQGPSLFVEKMANEANYPEAILTVAIQLYTDSSESDEAFERFVRRHGANLWMLDSLVRRSGSSGTKESVLEQLIAAHPQAERLRHLLEIHRAARRAAPTENLHEIERLYAMGEPEIWLALAGNPSTPRSLLEKLAEVKDVRLARRIRNRARDALGAVPGGENAW
ncbi:MAG TPA: hypothetical protein PK867_14785 [Pirellulales bacterium]|nr:hypothetical protein [Pirellulales bacterium]